MRPTVRSILFMFGLGLVLPADLTPVLAQGAAGEGGGEVRQVALTQKQIDGLLAAAPEESALQQKARPAGADQPDPQLEAQMDAIAKKHGFANLQAYGEAADSVGIVLAGVDPDTKAYVGAGPLIKKQIAQVEADKSLAPKDREQALSEMKEASANAGTVKPLPGNVDIVTKNYDKLAEAFRSAD